MGVWDRIGVSDKYGHHFNDRPTDISVSSFMGQITTVFWHIAIYQHYFRISVQADILQQVLILALQEKPTNCGTKAADVLANFLAGKL